MNRAQLIGATVGAGIGIYLFTGNVLATLAAPVGMAVLIAVALLLPIKDRRDPRAKSRASRKAARHDRLR